MLKLGGIDHEKPYRATLTRVKSPNPVEGD